MDEPVCSGVVNRALDGGVRFRFGAVGIASGVRSIDPLFVSRDLCFHRDGFAGGGRGHPCAAVCTAVREAVEGAPFAGNGVSEERCCVADCRDETHLHRIRLARNETSRERNDIRPRHDGDIGAELYRTECRIGRLALRLDGAYIDGRPIARFAEEVGIEIFFRDERRGD